MNANTWTLAAASGPILGMLGMAVPPLAAGSEPPDLPTNTPRQAERLWSASLRWENDTFSGDDRFYTDGVSLSLSHTGPSWMDPVANWLPWGEGRRTVAYDLAQAMFTPLTQGQAGGVVRFGYNMPDDFGPTLVRGMGHMPPPRREAPSRASDWGFSAYAGSVANLVLRDITLDGNTFEDSPSVDKEYFVPMAGVGISVGNRHFQVSFAYIFWGKEFEDQEDYSEFGTISASYFFNQRVTTD